LFKNRKNLNQIKREKKFPTNENDQRKVKIKGATGNGKPKTRV